MGRKRPWGCCMYILPAQMCLHLMIVKGGDVPCSAQPSRLGRYLADCFGGQRSHIYRRTLSVLEPRTEWAPSKACFCTCEGNISDELGCMEPPDAGRISSCMLRVFGGHSLGSIGRVGPWGRHRSRYDIYPGVSLSIMPVYFCQHILSIPQHMCRRTGRHTLCACRSQSTIRICS